MQKVKIISGWTNPGGSTIALANLCDAFNERGIECSFFGPHDWHLDKCKNAKTFMDLSIEKDDNIIAHYLGPVERFNCKRVLLSSHEKWWYKVAEQKPYWDAVVFLHDAHREYHSAYKGDSYVIPNIKEDFEKKNKEHLDKVAGIIGTIEERKQTHQSIKRALADGCDKIYLFGKIGDKNYFHKNVMRMVDNKRVFLSDYQDNKQRMYDQIGRVYHSSIGEVACLVKDECYSTGTKFFGNEETENEVSTKTNDEVVQMWVEAFND